jgi:hypothetical protein
LGLELELDVLVECVDEDVDVGLMLEEVLDDECVEEDVDVGVVLEDVLKDECVEEVVDVGFEVLEDEVGLTLELVVVVEGQRAMMVTGQFIADE